jgi:hypothetical protein
MEKNIQHNKELLLVSLTKYYKQNQHLYDIIAPIIEGRDISLRLIDYYMTTYSKKHNCVINKQNIGSITYYPVHANYRLQLRSYSKILFDTFRRRERILFYFDDKPLETTIGQLNFMKNLCENNIIQHIINNKDAIERDMVQTQKENNKNSEKIVSLKKNKDGTLVEYARKKRTQQKKNVTQLSKFEGKTTISFD